MNSRPHGLQRMPCRLIRVARSRKVTPFLRKLAEEKVNLIFQYGRLHGRQPGYSGIRVLACFLYVGQLQRNSRQQQMGDYRFAEQPHFIKESSRSHAKPSCFKMTAFVKEQKRLIQIKKPRPDKIRLLRKHFAGLQKVRALEPFSPAARTRWPRS